MNIKRNSTTHSLCWSCAKAGGSLGCPWVDRYPSGKHEVRNWKVKLIKRMNGEVSKVVLDCPLYEKDI